MTSLTIVDSEATVRNWARAETHITTVVGTRTFLSMPIAYPKAASAEWIVMNLVSETFQVGDLGMQEALIQFDCYSSPTTKGGTKAKAAAVALAVQTAGRLLSFGAPITVGAAVIAWADPQMMRWLPDPTLNIPRYVVDVLFALHGAEA